MGLEEVTSEPRLEGRQQSVRWRETEGKTPEAISLLEEKKSPEPSRISKMFSEA